MLGTTKTPFKFFNLKYSRINEIIADLPLEVVLLKRHTLFVKA